MGSKEGRVSTTETPCLELDGILKVLKQLTIILMCRIREYRTVQTEATEWYWGHDRESHEVGPKQHDHSSFAIGIFPSFMSKLLVAPSISPTLWHPRTETFFVALHLLPSFCNAPGVISTGSAEKIPGTQKLRNYPHLPLDPEGLRLGPLVSIFPRPVTLGPTDFQLKNWLFRM